MNKMRHNPFIIIIMDMLRGLTSSAPADSAAESGIISLVRRVVGDMMAPAAHPPKLYALPQAVPFATKMLEHLPSKTWGDKLADMTVRSFKNGETCIDISESVRGCSVFLVGWSVGDVNGLLMHMLIALDAFRRASPEKITVVLPMMPYARQDRKDASRQPITAKLVARMLEVAGADHVITMELHAAQIQGFFTIPCDNLYILPTFVKDYRPGEYKNLSIVSPDAGGGKRVDAAIKRFRKDAKYDNVEMVLMHKTRHADGSVTQKIIGDVQGRVCVIVDDMGDSCGTLINASKELVKAGAARVEAAIAHGVFSDGAVQNMAKEPALCRVYVSDTCIGAEILPPKFVVMSAASTFAQAVHKNYMNESVSELF